MTKSDQSDPSSGKQHLQSFGSFEPFASLLVLKEEKGEKEAKVNSSFPDVSLRGWGVGRIADTSNQAVFCGEEAGQDL